MAWFSISLAAGELGQSGAIAHWVARVRARSQETVASGRAIMLVASGVVATVAVVVSPILANGDPTLTIAYCVAFVGCLANGVWASFMYATQAVSIRCWNVIRISQPVFYA